METVDTCLKVMYMGIDPRSSEMLDGEMIYEYDSISEAKSKVSSYVEPSPTKRVRRMEPRERTLKSQDIASAQALLIGLMCKQMIIYAHENVLHDDSQSVARPPYYYDMSSGDRTHNHESPSGGMIEGDRAVTVAGEIDDRWSEEDDVKDSISSIYDVS
tara:strand:- start:466 stop:942 length:477 start_codon:yes stop_codon:yes gene_type:complete